MRINNNIPALNTHRLLSRNTNGLEKTLEKLSSGKRINKAADDAAGLAISQKMQAQIRGLRQASRNALDGVSLIQTAEGALNEVHSALQRMRELCVQGANGVNEGEDLKAIADEINQLTQQIEEIAENTEFNSKKLLNGSVGTSGETGTNSEESTSGSVGIIQLQIGANKDQVLEIDLNEIKITIDNSGIGIKGFVDEIKSKLEGEGLKSNDFQSGIDIFDTAITKVASSRSKLGAYQNRLEHTINNLDNTAENLTASMSRIEDVDMALEMSEFTKLNVLQQSGIAMLAQANQLPQAVLQLLK